MFTYLGEEHEITWSYQDVWGSIKHEAQELLPLNWSRCACRVKWVKALLLDDTRQYMVNLGLGLWLSSYLSRVLDTSVQAHVFDDVGVDYADSHIIQTEKRGVGDKHWLFLILVHAFKHFLIQRRLW